MLDVSPHLPPSISASPKYSKTKATAQKTEVLSSSEKPHRQHTEVIEH